MKFDELCSKIQQCVKDIKVACIVNADTYGVKFDSIKVGKSEVWENPLTKEQIIVFSKLEDLTHNYNLSSFAILIPESEVESVNVLNSAIHVLVKTGVYSISIT